MAQALRGQKLSDLIILRDRISNKHLRLEIQSISDFPIDVHIKMKGKAETKKFRSGAFGNHINSVILDPEKGKVEIHPKGAVEYIITRKLKHPGEIVPVIITYFVKGVEKKATFTFTTESGLVWSFHGTYIG